MPRSGRQLARCHPDRTDHRGSLTSRQCSPCGLCTVEPSQPPTATNRQSAPHTARRSPLSRIPAKSYGRPVDNRERSRLAVTADDGRGAVRPVTADSAPPNSLP